MTAALNPNLARVAPELRAMLEFFPELDFSQGMEAFRGGFGARPAVQLPPELAAVTCVERHVPGIDGEPDVRVLHYTPPAVTSTGAILHIHGGGYVLGDPEINDGGNRAQALALGCTVVSVDYRLAPECVWPGALHDCYAALLWLHGQAGALGFDSARIVVTGESAGGGHAAALALFARDRHRANPAAPQIAALVMDAPMLDDRTGTTADPHPHTGHFVWTPDKNRFGWGALLGRAPGGDDVPAGAVPARASDLSGLPPSFITVGALDLFLEENLEWTRRLSREGTPVELHVIPGGYHGFGIAQGSPQTAMVQDLRLKALARALSA
ncbi:MAG: alpha/beta hydrolase [Sphingomonadales bacterium]|nr:alpha/beta hydrolase [Sphingomonadales bacterium]